MILENKKILIVGAAGLLGATLVKEVVAQGARVVAADLSIERLLSRLSECGLNPGDGVIEIRQIDLSDTGAVVSMFDELEGLTGAVNCSYPRNRSYGNHFFDVKVEDFNENISLNLGSSFLFMQQCAAYFKAVRNDFALVNISSIYGVVAPKFEVYDNTMMTMPVEYAAIKSALLHMSKYVVAYIADSRFRVNCVSPGGIFDNQASNFLDAYKRQTLGKGMLDVKDVIGSIIYLLSDYSSYVNGQNIVVDDGFIL